jgi:hypothetical protein
MQLRKNSWTNDTSFLALHETEDPDALCLTRRISAFVPEGALYRRVDEQHLLRLYRSEDVAAILTRTGFVWEKLARYADFEFAPGWHGYVAQKWR